MKIEVRVPNTTIRFTDRIHVEIAVTNTGARSVALATAVAEVHYLVNGKEDDWETPGGRASVTLGRGESFVIATGHRVSLHRVFEGEPRVEPFRFAVTGKILVDRKPVAFASKTLRLGLDCSKLRVLPAPDGTPSSYLHDGEHVLYVSAGGTKISKVAANAAKLRVLSDAYVIDDKSVFHEGRALAGVRPKGFRVLNGVFAGTASAIFTEYGNAKVRDPKSFEVLDAGAEDPDEGYKKSFGRDKHHVYFWNGAGSAAHASIVKACKRPASFVRDRFNYSRDDDAIYCEAARITGADPKTWKPINSVYSKDAARVFHLHRTLPGANPKTFKAPKY